VDDWQIVDIKPNWQRKAERAAELAQKHEEKSDEAYDRAHKKLDVIPFGQPILVGHHSEKRHRSDLRKIGRLEKKGREEAELADKYQRRAERFGQKATGESPVLIYNRIQRLEAEKRKTEKQLRIAETGEQSIYYPSKLSNKEKERLRKWMRHYDTRLKIEREKYEASGGIPTDKLTLKAGDRVKTRFGTGTLGTVSKKTVRVKLDPDPISGRPRWIYSDAKGYSKLAKTEIIEKA